MKQLFIGLMLLFAACGVPTGETSPTKYAVQDTTILQDTIPTIDITIEQDTTLVTITSNSISINALNLQSTTNEEVKEVLLRFSEGELSYAKVNEVILYGTNKEVQHKYTFSNANTIVVQKGNTLNGISKDFNISISNLRKLNPNLGKILPVGKTIHIK